MSLANYDIENRTKAIREFAPGIIRKAEIKFFDSVSKVIVTEKADPQLFKKITVLPINAELIYRKA